MYALKEGHFAFRGNVTHDIPPVFVAFVDLRNAFYPLHHGDHDMVSDLHDVWKAGAPSPDSIIRNPKEYDERKRQAGNVEKRLILPTLLMGWIVNASNKRGMPLSAAQAAALIDGQVRYTW